MLINTLKGIRKPQDSPLLLVYAHSKPRDVSRNSIVMYHTILALCTRQFRRYVHSYPTPYIAHFTLDITECGLYYMLSGADTHRLYRWRTL